MNGTHFLVGFGSRRRGQLPLAREQSPLLQLVATIAVVFEVVVGIGLWGDEPSAGGAYGSRKKIISP